MIIYTVKNGDTLYHIARRYGSTVEKIARDNELRGSALSVGETLVILQPKTVYTVKEGENLYSVAQQFGVSIGDLWRNNHFLGGGTELRAGEILTIVPEAPKSEREIAVNAYVFPSVDRAVLRKALPYLTYVTIFGARPTVDGGLDETDDGELIELARQYGVAPMLLVSSLSERGTYSSELAARILSDKGTQAMLIEEIATALTRKRYAGVEMDFQYLPRAMAKEYVEFVRTLKKRLSEGGYRTVVSLSPKTASDQGGLLYEGHDYRGMGDASDHTFLMTCQWGNSYGPPMAVAPLHRVTEVVDYALGEIPAEKIVLGIPSYGYDWSVPREKETRRGVWLGAREAVALAKEKRARIEFDEESAAPYFRYFEREDGKPTEHVVWFEDANSVKELLSLVEIFDLNGIGVWTAMKEFPQLWTVLNATYRIQKGLA